MSPTDTSPDGNGGVVVIDASQGAVAIHASHIAEDGWNGFARPSFTIDEVKVLSTHLTGLYGDALVAVDPETDTVTVLEEGYEEPYKVEPVLIDGVDFYPIGAGAWTWERHLDEG